MSHDTTIEDQLDCLNRNISKVRSDIRRIVHEELEEALKNAVQELRKPKPYIERGHRE